jgi:hypothetical protein
VNGFAAIARPTKFFPDLLVGACFVALLACVGAVAFVLEAMPEASAPPLAVANAAPGRDEAPARARCDGCGVIESIQHVAASGNAAATYGITVRMRDGSTRVSSDARPANWRTGDRIVLIDDTNPPGR